jgi:hypothetical protein
VLSQYGPDGRRRGERRRGAPGWIVQAVVLLVVLAVAGLAVFGPSPEPGGVPASERLSTLIQNLSVAALEYKATYGTFPPDRDDVHADLNLSGERLAYYLSGAALAYDPETAPEDFRWRHPIFADTTRDASGRRSLRTFIHFRKGQLADVDADGIPEIADPWGRPLEYRSTNPSHNTTTFDLWSVGLDGRGQTADDVGNW